MKWSGIGKSGYKKWTNICSYIHYIYKLREKKLEITISIDWDKYCTFIFSLEDTDFNYLFHDKYGRQFKVIGEENNESI